jgi:hypothetical protein
MISNMSSENWSGSNETNIKTSNLINLFRIESGKLKMLKMTNIIYEHTFIYGFASAPNTWALNCENISKSYTATATNWLQKCLNSKQFILSERSSYNIY